MRLTQSQQKKILEIGVSSLWRNDRKAVRQLFDVCEADGASVRGYKYLLERATKVLARTCAAIEAMEKEDQP